MLSYDLKGKNKYYTLYTLIRGDIIRGKIKEGEKLPSKRSLAEELGVSVVTVQLAYDQLLAEGYIRSKERSGYYAEDVSALAPPDAANPPVPSVVSGVIPCRPENSSRPFELPSRHSELFSCHSERSEESPRLASLPVTASQTGLPYKIDLVKGNVPPEMFPFTVWTRLIRGVLADCGEHLLERVPGDGDTELKNALSAYLYRSRGIDVDPRYIVVGAGAEHLYGVIVQLLGRDKIFAVENPGYGKISSTYILNGARCVPVNVGEWGMDISALKQTKADIAHISPSHQFPTGAVMPVKARSELIEWAKSVDGYVIEDDYDSEFRLDGKPLQCAFSLCPERVVYLNTFSKSLAPSMRMGYMVLPPALYQKFMSLFSASANFVPLFEQKTLAKMLSGGYFERHISRLKNYYRNIRKLLEESLTRLGEACEVADTGSGLHVIAKFPFARSDGEIKRKAEERGVRIKCLSDYLLAPLEGAEKCAVINYAGLTSKMFDHA